MALTNLEDLHVTTVIGGPQGDNDMRRAFKKWAQMPPEGVVGNVGAATVVAEEFGNAVERTTKLTLTNFVVNAAEPDNADLAIGALVYSLPGGALIIEHASFYGTVTKAGEATIGDGEIGLGTLVGSGAVDTLGEVDAAAENICGPTVITSGEFDGAQVYTGVSAPNLYVAPAGGVAHSVFLNIAATWPDVEPASTIRFNGVITLKWRKMN